MSKPSTRDRLIQAASHFFAEKGYHNTTVAEICEAAEANIAAVNYHFGDKETLYDEVWRHAFAVTKSTYPVEIDEQATSDPEENLYRYAHAILHRTFCEEEAGLFPRLLNQEMTAPTLALDKIAEEALYPQSQQVEKVVLQVLGAAANQHIICLCKHSIIGQCAFYNFSRGLRERVMGCRTMDQADIDQMARHIAQFSLGGLNAIQQGTQPHE